MSLVVAPACTLATQSGSHPLTTPGKPAPAVPARTRYTRLPSVAFVTVVALKRPVTGLKMSRLSLSTTLTTGWHSTTSTRRLPVGLGVRTSAPNVGTPASRTYWKTLLSGFAGTSGFTQKRTPSVTVRLSDPFCGCTRSPPTTSALSGVASVVFSCTSPPASRSSVPQ